MSVKRPIMAHDLWLDLRKVWRQIDDVVKYEAGELNDEETVALFQALIDSGLAWSLSPQYGRVAADLIALGVCEATTPKPRN